MTSTYAKMLFQRSNFFFTDEDPSFYENKSAYLAGFKPTRTTVQELCYRYDLKILDITDREVQLCTPKGMLVGFVYVHPDLYAFDSPFIVKSRGARSTREYNNLRALIKVLSDDIDTNVPVSLRSPEVNEKIFERFYRYRLNRLFEYKTDWFSSEKGHRETNRIYQSAWSSDKFFSFEDGLELIDSVFSGDSSKITSNSRYQEKYEKLKEHMTGEKYKQESVNRALKRSMFFQLCGKYEINGIMVRDLGVLTAEVSFHKDQENNYVVTKVNNVKRTRNLESCPEVLANFTMLKTMIGHTRYDEYLTYYHEFEMSTDYRQSSSSGWTERYVNYQPTFLMPITSEVTE